MNHLSIMSFSPLDIESAAVPLYLQSRSLSLGYESSPALQLTASQLDVKLSDTTMTTNNGLQVHTDNVTTWTNQNGVGIQYDGGTMIQTGSGLSVRMDDLSIHQSGANTVAVRYNPYNLAVGVSGLETIPAVKYIASGYYTPALFNHVNNNQGAYTAPVVRFSVVDKCVDLTLTAQVVYTGGGVGSTLYDRRIGFDFALPPATTLDEETLVTGLGAAVSWLPAVNTEPGKFTYAKVVWYSDVFATFFALPPDIGWSNATATVSVAISYRTS